MIADYHIHTRLCRHAEGEPREYVERAIGLSMSEMGFADHLPFLGGWRPGHGIPGDDWSMELDELDGYVSLVQALAREYAADLRILVGIEADYIEETLDDTARVLGEYPFDHPASRDRVQGYGIDRMHLESLGNVERAAATGLFHVIGHLDQAKKFGHRPDDVEAVTAAASRALRAVRQAGAALELNTAGLRKPVGEAYPAPGLLAEARALGIPLTFGSDAHRPEEVGWAFDQAAVTEREAGYAATLRLAGGLPEPL